MSQTLLRATILAVALFLLCDTAYTQTAPVNCSDAVALPLNDPNLNGVWYQIARNPKASQPIGCVEWNVSTNSSNTGLNITVTDSKLPDSWWQNQTTTSQLAIDANANTVQFNLTGSTQPATIKLLYVETASFALVCGYTNATDNSTTVGMVISRNRSSSISSFPNFTTEAQKYNIFFNQSELVNVTQTKACYTKSAAYVSAVPFMTAIFAAVYAVLKLTN